MILKGSQRASGGELAVHLMRLDDNEHVKLHELRGFACDDLKGAFKEAEAASRGTKCRQYLFSLSLSPPPSARVPVADFEAAIQRIETRLGLEGQPRAIVFHEKEGRRHAHCVWSRIDAETMTARPLPFFKQKLMGLIRRHIADSKERFRQRAEKVAETKAAMTTMHRRERVEFDSRLRREWVEEAKARAGRLPRPQARTLTFTGSIAKPCPTVPPSWAASF